MAVQQKENGLGRDASGCGAELDHDDSFRWDKIWRLAVPNKVKIFLWRLAHNNLAVKRNLARRGVDSETICPMCYRLDEDWSFISKVQKV
jgi:hypothetical protein